MIAKRNGWTDGRRNEQTDQTRPDRWIIALCVVCCEIHGSHWCPCAGAEMATGPDGEANKKTEEEDSSQVFEEATFALGVNRALK